MLTAQRVDVSHYRYSVAWSREDEEFVATCAEFPSLSWLAEGQVEAIEGLEALVADVISDLSSNGEEVPEPLAERKYSGKFNLRVGEHLHRDLVVRAAERRMSLNAYVVLKLSEDD